MLWVPLVWPFNFYLNIAHHTVFCLDVILFASFNLVRLACLFMMLSCFDSNNNNKYHQVLMRATRLWLFPLTDGIFETGAYAVPSKSQNPIVLGQGGPSSTQCSNPSWA